MAYLPMVIALESKYNYKYLRYLKEHGCLQSSGEEILSQCAKYEIEPTENSGNDGGYVHIRCCYNNKYLVTQSVDDPLIVARADKPEEDQSKWSCTLFKPVQVDGGGGSPNTFRFLHVHLQSYACLWRTDSRLYARSSPPDEGLCNVFIIIDLESLMILPKHVAFKADNGKYVSLSGSSDLTCLASDIGDAKVGTEIIPTRDGSIHIKSDSNGRFWKSHSLTNGIHAGSRRPKTRFLPIQIGNNIVALKNIKTNLFYRRTSHNGLRCDAAEVTKEARFEVEERIISRSVNFCKYRLTDARIYNVSIIAVATVETSNSSLQPVTKALSLEYKNIATRTWNTSLSLTLGVKAEFETGIPTITGGKIEISSSFKEQYEWGHSSTTETTLSNTYTITVPPMTKMKLSLRATRGSCEVPFSYAQRDTLINGHRPPPYEKDDGCYTGANCYNFHCHTEEEKL